MNKFILVPQDLYRGLLSKPSTDINLDFAKGSLDKAKSNRKLDASAKNVLYNQELRRYLKIKRDIEDKPVKVELTNGAQLLTHNGQTAIIEDDEMENVSSGSPLSTTSNTSCHKPDGFE